MIVRLYLKPTRVIIKSTLKGAGQFCSVRCLIDFLARIFSDSMVLSYRTSALFFGASGAFPSVKRTARIF